ncbi:hypothetical protein HZC30_05665 [Candidatus Woesearchaeota archaeon]|nr:hypothetical protein [Candidatus Woesearchaeota archaeon]
MAEIIHGGLEGRVGLRESKLKEKVNRGDVVVISGPSFSAGGYVTHLDGTTIHLSTENPFGSPEPWAYSNWIPPLAIRYRLVEFTECYILEKRKE